MLCPDFKDDILKLTNQELIITLLARRRNTIKRSDIGSTEGWAISLMVNSESLKKETDERTWTFTGCEDFDSADVPAAFIMIYLSRIGMVH